MSDRTASRTPNRAGALESLKARGTVVKTDSGPGWRTLSDVYTDLAKLLSERHDLVVDVLAPNSDGRPALPYRGMFWPDLARIDLDGTLLSGRPDQLDPSSEDVRVQLANLHGVFIHELGHADYSRWAWPEALEQLPDGAALCATMALLEEIRMEARVVAQRPEQSRWLRQAVIGVILPELPEAIESPWHAAQVATLTLGRVRAGSLEPEDLGELEASVSEVLGDDVYELLTQIWDAAINVDDLDGKAMQTVAEALCTLIEQPPSDTPGPANGAPREGAPGSAGTSVADLQKQAQEAAQEAAQRSAELPDDPVMTSIMKDIESMSTDASAAGHGSAAGGQTLATAQRTATAAERTARAHLARELEHCRFRESTRVRAASERPPGRLRMRGALNASAQRTAGRRVTAQPWRQTRKVTQRTPAFDLALLIDTSGSMSPHAAAVASAAWILAGAVVDNGGSLAVATFGDDVQTLPLGGRVNSPVIEFDANGGTEMVIEALDLASNELDLGNSGRARVVLILSDGRWYGDNQLTGARTRIDEMLASGVQVVQMNIGSKPKIVGGALEATLARPEDLAGEGGRHIGQLLANAPASPAM